MDIRGKYLSHAYLMLYVIVITIMAMVQFVIIIEISKPVVIEEPTVRERLKSYTNNDIIINSIIKWSNSLEVDPFLVAAIIKYESGFNVYAVNENRNGSIDRGLMQLNNQVYGDSLNFWDIDLNIQLGVNNIKWCLDQSNGNVIKALAMYNTGIVRVKGNRVPEMTLDYSWKIISELRKWD